MAWLAVAFAVAGLDWLSVARGWRRLGYLTKPGVMAVLAVALVQAGAGGLWLVAVLASLVGDVLLMLPRERFLGGLVAFLVAHGAYVAAFWSSGPPPWHVGLLGLALAVGLAGGRLYRSLAQGLAQRGQAGLRGPVAVYALALGLMLVAAGSTLWRPNWPRGAAVAALVGATLFFASDALLAWDRFVQPVARGRLKVRVLYHLGQVLLVGAALAFMG